MPENASVDEAEMRHSLLQIGERTMKIGERTGEMTECNGFRDDGSDCPNMVHVRHDPYGTAQLALCSDCTTGGGEVYGPLDEPYSYSEEEQQEHHTFTEACCADCKQRIADEVAEEERWMEEQRCIDERCDCQAEPTLWSRVRYWVARFVCDLRRWTVAAAAGKSVQRIGSCYQLVFLGLLLIGSQCGLFVYLAFPLTYIAIVLGHWIAGATTVPTVIQASSTDAFKYLGVVVAEWLQLSSVWFIVRSGFRPLDLIGVAQSRKQLLIEVAFGIGLGVVEATYSVLPILLRNAHPHMNLVPRLPGEAILAIAASLSAGVVEEIVYRGYLQRLVTDVIGNIWVAIALQAEAFAFAHLYEGGHAVGIIAIQSLVTGYLAYRLKNLRLVIVAHVTLDVIVSLTGFMF
jgi:membrane protease YdiL (CAAX protease family)